MALTNDDIRNLSIAIARACWHPSCPHCAAPNRRRPREHGILRHQPIINPLQKFGEYTRTGVARPAAFHFLEWLTGEPGITVKPHRDPRMGAGCCAAMATSGAS